MSIVTYNNRSIANISAIPGTAKSLTHIKTLTASSSSTLDFLNGSDDVVFDSTYPIYMFKYINVHPATNQVNFQFQVDTGTNTNYNITCTSSTFRARHDEDGSDGALAYRTQDDQAQGTSFQRLVGNITNGNDESGSGELFLFNPSSTTFVKHFISKGNCHYNTNSSLLVYHVAGYFNTTTALTRIRFKMSSGNIDAGTIKLYGIKDS